MTMAEPAPEPDPAPAREIVVRAFDGDAVVDREERTIVATVNTAAIDRYQTVILPDGARLDNYRKNPVVLYNHRDDLTPIGRNLWVKMSRGRLVAKTRFLPEGKDGLADKVFDLYDLGFLNAWSIRFNPFESGAPTPEEIRKRPDLAGARCIFRVWDLLEYSCVTLPGNPEAVREARSRGLALPGWPDDEPPPVTPPPARDASLAPPLPPLVGRTPEDYLRAIRARVAGDVAGRSREVARDAVELARGMA
jgi:hypothetical protein